MRASVDRGGTSIFARKLFTSFSTSACRDSGIQWANTSSRLMCLSLGVFAYDCDLASSINSLKAVGPQGSWWSRAALSSQPRPRAQKKTKRSIAGLRATSLRAVSTSCRILWQTSRTYSWIIFSFSWSATALNLYNSHFTRVASRAWTVSTVTWSSLWEALDHRLHQTRPGARLDETLVDRQIDTVLPIDRHRISWKLGTNKGVPNSRAGNEPADAAGEQRALPCWASRNLVKIVAGHQELETVFVAQEELVV